MQAPSQAGENKGGGGGGGGGGRVLKGIQLTGICIALPDQRMGWYPTDRGYLLYEEGEEPGGIYV